MAVRSAAFGSLVKMLLVRYINNILKANIFQAGKQLKFLICQAKAR
jgi:hypothetical protein